jgi:tetratricopeptide (TPR) repeat protein
MAGECQRKLGHPAEALDAYNAALKLYLAFPNWMLGVQFPPNVAPQSGVGFAPWGQTVRRSRAGRFQATLVVLTDTVLLDPVPPADGSSSMINAGAPILMDVREVVRCTALALKRRREILGPMVPHDPLTAALAALFARRPAPANPVAQAWIDAAEGFAYLAKGQSTDALNLLKRAESIEGVIDTPLTPLALLQEGQAALAAGKFNEAGALLAEASYSACDFRDQEVLEEAFRDGLQAYLAVHPGAADVFPQLAPATAWARNRGQAFRAELLLLAAEHDAALRRTGAAADRLGDARAVIGKHEMAGGDLGARLSYLSALVAYQQGKQTAGDNAIGEALTYERGASPRSLQIRVADAFATSLQPTPSNHKAALSLYAELLRDPTPQDWSGDSLATIAELMTPRSAVFEHWFEQAVTSDSDLSLEVADRLRRRRFLSTLPLGGRLTALRLVLESPQETLDKQTQMQRQELLTRYPHYVDLLSRVEHVQAELKSAPLAATGAEATRKQREQLTELGRIAAEKETLLYEIAVGREPAELAFPPLRSAQDVQSSLGARQLMLVFFSTRDANYAWLMTKNRRAAWKIKSSPAELERTIATLLRAIGNTGPNAQAPSGAIADAAWQKAARAEMDAITAGSKVNLSANFDELIIVPDGVLWYLPFEALPVGGTSSDGGDRPLLAKCRIRYAPTLGLAMADRRQRRGIGAVGVVAAKLQAGDLSEVLPAGFDRLAQRGASVTEIKRPLPAASPLYGSLFDTLAVCEDLSAGERGGERLRYEWPLIGLDRNRSFGAFSQWLAPPRLPATQVLLPAFRTLAENSLVHAGSAERGDDLFLPICGLMSAGARTVLISRWRTGGKSSEQLVAEFAQELPHTTAADAWQRSVQLLWETPLDFNREPRLAPTSANDGATGRHPLMWSGYIIVDTGAGAPDEAKPLAVAH